MPEGSKVHDVYEALLRKGASKESAAKIAQSQTGEALATGRPAKHQNFFPERREQSKVNKSEREAIDRHKKGERHPTWDLQEPGSILGAEKHLPSTKKPVSNVTSERQGEIHGIKGIKDNPFGKGTKEYDDYEKGHEKATVTQNSIFFQNGRACALSTIYKIANGSHVSWTVWRKGATGPEKLGVIDAEEDEAKAHTMAERAYGPGKYGLVRRLRPEL